MKLVYQCEYCDFRGISDAVILHEQHCEKNPVNIKKKEKLKWIAEHCPHRSECYDEYYFFWGCRKDGYTGRHALDCEPTIDCLQYCEGENLWNHVT